MHDILIFERFQSERCAVAHVYFSKSYRILRNINKYEHKHHDVTKPLFTNKSAARDTIKSFLSCSVSTRIINDFKFT